MASDNSLENPKYSNWIKANLALKCCKPALQTLVEDGIQTFLNDVLQTCTNKFCNKCTVYNITPCWTPQICYGPKRNCTFHDKKDPCREARPCPNGICDKLYQEIVHANQRSKTNWDNTNAREWCINHWTIAKCFMPTGYSKIESAENTDLTGILSVMINAKFMTSYLVDGNSVVFSQVPSSFIS